jgi:glycosyltransferase involved in cell wall biosynthesis
MKIVLFSFLYESEIGGGAAVVVNQLAHLLEQRSHSVVVITTWKGNYVKTDHVDGIKIIRIPPKNLYWVGDKNNQPISKKIVWQLVDIWNPLTYQMVRQILINEKPDIIHSHKLRGLSPSIWSAAASVKVRKIIHTCHDYELLSPEGMLMGRVGNLALEQNLMMRPYQSLRRYFSRLVQYATAPSRFVLDLHQKMRFFPLAETEVIPNAHGFGISELSQDYSKSRNLSQKNGPKRFLYIGRLDKEKGVDLLCQAFIQFASQNQHVLLRIAGWGPLDASLREKYEHRNNIEFIGPVFGNQKAKLFRDSDVLVAPSIAPEPFGIVVIEAYFYGLPVIATRIGAFLETVMDEETGFLVKPGSVGDLATAFSRITSEKNLINDMSRNCFKEAQKFSTEKIYEKYLIAYKGKKG